ncbi:hypothetical protein HGB48_00550 [Actinomadura latina]|uniref:Glyoxalase-like domain-containing protein n=1 Tax=Actinomadura latina TaxID=163603 RepID=A0A846YU66_9ACTN|nr:VOC family protein [Actinomadura latina]NKZ02255.1 hypothetical protein [Actinomadura latina]
MATRLVQINMKAWDDVALGEFWAEAARLRALGATDADIGQDDVPWTVLADPEGNEFCVLSPA